MKYNPLYVKQLEEIISAGLKEVAIPYQKGNSIRIKHMIVRKHSNGYRVFDCRCNKHIETVFCKTAAVAIAKGLAEDKNYRIDPVLSLDHQVSKHYNDALYAKRSKYDIAVDKAWSCLDQLEKFIFDK